MMQKVRWAGSRIVFLVMAMAGTASGGLVSYLLGPLYSWYFFNDTRFFRYHRLTFPIVASCWKLICEWVRNPEYRKMFAIPLSAPPMMEPDRTLVQIDKTWPKKDGACNGCVRCCIQRSCPMLNREMGLCRSYGSFFWRYFNCGRYPENEAQIRYYDCRKWQMRHPRSLP